MFQPLRFGEFPERTIYEITDAGRDTARLWLWEQLAQPAREFPAFPAALSFLPLLTPDDVRLQLETRIAALGRELARVDTLRESAEAMRVPRLFLLEGELMRATLKIELDWVTSVVDDLRTGSVIWSEPWLREIAERFAPLTDAAPATESSREN